MDYHRRKLLSCLVFAATLPSHFLKKTLETNGVTDNHPWRVVFRTTLPHEMTLKEYKETRTAFRNAAAADQFFEGFRRQGKILREELHFSGRYADWTVTFKNKGAAQEWLAQSENSGATDESRLESMGFRRRVHLSRPS